MTDSESWVPSSETPTSWGDVSAEDLVHSEPFGLKQLRWTKSAGQRLELRAEMNRALDDFAPLFVTSGQDVFEVKPTQLYIALEQLPLKGASDEALRAYAALRETVIGDLVYEAHNAIHEVLDED